jgi:hypothetical protein
VSKKTEMVEIDKRLKNVEQIVDIVKHVSSKAVDSWTKYLEQKSQQAQKESFLADAQHQRAIKVLAYLVSLIFILTVIALFQHQYELVQIIIGSSLGVAAGAGIRSIFKGKIDSKS